MTSPSSPNDRSPGLRASDADRERVAAALRRHHVDGRIDTDELQERLERCYAARTTDELAALTTDLPGDERPRAPRLSGGPPHRVPLGAVVLAVLLTMATVGAIAHGHPGPLPLLILLLVVFRFGRFGPRRRRTAWSARG
jgi:Domain of unknown function (DUF1707)